MLLAVLGMAGLWASNVQKAVLHENTSSFMLMHIFLCDFDTACIFELALMTIFIML